MTPPCTYAQWVSAFECLKEKTDDAGVLEAMKLGSIQWQSGVAERFSQKLVDAMNHRLNAATDKFQKDMGRSRGQEREIVQALLSLRKELSFLAKAVDLPAIPEKERKQYVQLVLDQANTVQRSLEDSAKNDRTGKLASLVRNHKVNVE